MIYEFQSEAWHEDVVAMLSEDRSSLFVGGGDQLGSTIVGSWLDQVQDPEAKALFKMLAVLPEGVQVPMQALELIWCGHRDVTPPLSRLQLMKCRKYAFELIDRNLVLGETVNGIYTHDVVRDYCRGLVEPAELRGRQRAVARAIVAAVPENGWPRLGAVVLAAR